MPAGKGSGNYGSIEVFWDDLRIANIGEIDRKTEGVKFSVSMGKILL